MKQTLQFRILKLQVIKRRLAIVCIALFASLISIQAQRITVPLVQDASTANFPYKDNGFSFTTDEMASYYLDKEGAGTIVSNYVGNVNWSWANGDCVNQAALKFTLPATSSVLSTAKLHLPVRDIQGTAWLNVTLTDDNAWQQTNLPATSTYPSLVNTKTLLSTQSVSSSGNVAFSLDPTNLRPKITSSGTTNVTFILTGNTTTNNYFNFVADDDFSGDKAYLRLSFKPQVQSVSVPANSTYKIGDALNFIVSFDSLINVTGTPRLPITFNTGGTGYASYLTGSGSQNLIFRYTVASGDLDADGITIGSAIALNGGTIRSDGSDDAELNLYSVGLTTNVRVDGIAPTINSVSPPGNATYVAGQNLDYTVNFSEAVNVVKTSGTPYLTLTIGSTTAHATYVSGTGTSALVFRYTIVPGDYDVDSITLASNITLNGGTIKDGAGNDAALSFAGGTATGVQIGTSPLAITAPISDISSSTVTLKGSVNPHNMSTTVTFEYGTSTSYGSSATASQSPVTGTSEVNVSCALTGLLPNTTYYYRVNATNTAGTSNGSQASFTTLPQAPTVTTQAVSSIGTTAATGNGTITSLGVPNPTAYGVCWSTTQGAESATGNSVSNGVASTTGAFTASITGLTAGTTYYVKAFATNSANTSYGTEVLFTTQTIPTITWNNPGDITYGTLLTETQLNATASVPGTYTYTPALGTKLDVGTAQNLKVDFTPTDATNYTSATKTVTIDVTRATPVITWASPAGITYGTTLSATQLNATADVAGTFTYTPALGTKPDAGTAQNLKIDFTPTDATNYTSATKTVTIDVAKANPVIIWSTPAGITYGATLSAAQLNATSDVAGTFTYTPALGTKPDAGTAQNLKVDFTPTDATNYTSATKTVTIDVAKATSVITWATPTGIPYGTTLSATQLNAAADVPGTFTYTPALGTKPDAGTAQNLKVDFTPTDATNYTSATKTVTIDVAKATPVITWATPTGIPYGTTLSASQLNATSDVAGTFTYTPALGTKPDAGTAQNLKVDFTPTDATNYTSATKTVTIDVAKANPVITWNNPADISNATALSTTQLNASADVPGIFTYTPAIGTKLNAGNAQVLKADFVPSDLMNYETASKTVLINVFLTTGISEVENNEYVVLYPNPVMDAFNVLGIDSKATISITDLNGKVVLSKIISVDEKVSVTNLPSGVYLIKIITNNGSVLKKIVKK